ncbi:MAG: sulfite exporter TauE/SafE family protein [Saprospiraceae bacterium]|nr:sulfite exporter TauE/SafE family protein [Saprospiraceae bacterium]
MIPEILLYLSILTVAYLYASVGHGGASGYLAVMGLFAVSTATMRPTALLMNCLVSLIAFIQFYRSGYFNFKLFMLFALTSVPAAFLGGTIELDEQVYKKILAIVLFFSVYHLLKPAPKESGVAIQAAQPLLAGLLGAFIGLLSGLIGIGGGILLSPLLILLRWASIKQTAAVSAIFIFVNSLAGLAGMGFAKMSVHPSVWYFLAFAIIGGFLGAHRGAFQYKELLLKRILAGVLCIAALKLLFV